MVKKVMAILLAATCLFSLAACGGPASSEEQPAVSVPADSAASNSLSTPNVEEEQELPTEFACSAKELFEAVKMGVSKDTENPEEYLIFPQYVEYEGGGILAAQSAAFVKFFAFQDKNTGKATAMAVQLERHINDWQSQNAFYVLSTAMQTGLPRQNLTDQDLRSLIDACNQDREIHEVKGCGMKTLIDSEKGTTAFFIFPAGAEIDVGKLPLQVPISPDSLLPDENTYKEIKALAETYDFLTLRDKIKTFIEAGGVPEDDIAYLLWEKLDKEELAQAISKCTITVDPVENKANVTYNGVGSITSSVNVMAQIKNGEQEFWVGFTAPDWLFFTHYKIALGDDDYLSGASDYSNVTREIIGGGILEKAKTRFSAEKIEKICNAQEPIIRFADEKNDKTRDHVITESEQDCLKTIDFLYKTYLEVNNTLFYWEKLYLM